MIQVVVLLEIGDYSAFREFERNAAEVMKIHRGQILSAFAPNLSLIGNPRIGEVHILQFPDLQAFEAYRNDALLKQLSELRKKAILNTEIFISERFVDVEAKI